jgi:diguanylate cyclase (GGDEF)-like protein
MLAASLAPWIGNFIYQAGLSPYGIDINPFAMATSGPIFALALFRFRLFDLSPIARESIVEGMTDPVIVLDKGNRIADYNGSAMSVFSGLGKGAIGADVMEVLGRYPRLLEQIGKTGDAEIRIYREGAALVYQSRVSPLYSRRKHPVGTVITLRDITEKTELLTRLQQLATVDDLTGAFNRRHFMDRGSIEIDRARRHEKPCSVIILDLDHFKAVNDSYGHQVGDTALEHSAALCMNTLRPSDLFGRYGGEEFAVLLPETEPDAAERLAERMRETLAGTALSLGELEITVTASFGVAGADTVGPMDTLDALLGRADAALYRAKEEGRNRVERG